MKDLIKEIGSKLVEDSKLNEEFSFQRGLVNELFPYIYEASKRMSSRGISRWLEANGTKLSAATIAKALRNPKPYWQEVYEEIEPAAIVFARAHEVDPEEILSNREFFFYLETKPPFIEGVNPEIQHNCYDEYQDAKRKLKEDWFSMPSTICETCLSNLAESEETTETQPTSKTEVV